jgi:hypothetical protein
VCLRQLCHSVLDTALFATQTTVGAKEIFIVNTKILPLLSSLTVALFPASNTALSDANVTVMPLLAIKVTDRMF